jgi:hypothetical protein
VILRRNREDQCRPECAQRRGYANRPNPVRANLSRCRGVSVHICRAAVAAVAGLVLVGGCDQVAVGNDSPAISTSPHASTTASASVSPETASLSAAGRPRTTVAAQLPAVGTIETLTVPTIQRPDPGPAMTTPPTVAPAMTTAPPAPTTAPPTPTSLPPTGVTPSSVPVSSSRARG